MLRVAVLLSVFLGIQATLLPMPYRRLYPSPRNRVMKTPMEIAYIAATEAFINGNGRQQYLIPSRVFNVREQRYGDTLITNLNAEYVDSTCSSNTIRIKDIKPGQCFPLNRETPKIFQLEMNENSGGYHLKMSYSSEYQ